MDCWLERSRERKTGGTEVASTAQEIEDDDEDEDDYDWKQSGQLLF
jgi:hypothetical protein